MNEERMRILKMIEAGTISAEDGAKLLEALGSAEETAAPRPTGASPRWLRVRVVDPGGRNKVHVNVPLKLLDVAKRFIPSGMLNFNGQAIDFDEILALIREGAEGKLVEVEGEDGEHVEIFVE
ncbi:MAG: hypothetical protein IMW98_02010 [Firmicutes bacterium]|nr:hypothetical protein [Bacillota bacterium]